ncbi:MAG: hypothetical protein AB1726_03035 [Planctomycetota bacterium]
MSLRARIRDAVERGELGEIEGLVAGDPRAVRHLLGLTYHPADPVRQVACRGVALAGKHHRRLVQNLVRRLVWAMNDESGTNALTAPPVILAIANEAPELLLPMVADLVRLASDEGLHAGLAAALRIVSDRCPGRVGEEMQKALNQRWQGGESDVA